MWEVRRGKGRSVDPDREEAKAFWLRFGRDSVYSTKSSKPWFVDSRRKKKKKKKKKRML